MKHLLTKLFALILFILVSSVAYSQTNIAANITTNTTWTTAGSPYNITNNITINSGVTLTINAGVTVRVNDGFTITVLGNLSANSATFTTSNSSPAAGRWNQIRIGSGTISGTASLSSCQILYAQTGISIEKGTATLNTTDITNCSANGIYVTQASTLNMTGGTISNITNSNSIGIYVYDGTANLTSININSSNVGLVLSSLLSTTSNAYLSGNTITNCVFPIRYDGGSNLSFSGTNSLTGNTNNYININFNTLNTRMSLPSITYPIVFGTSGFTINNSGRLNIGNGNILKFRDNTTFSVSGKLISNTVNTVVMTTIRDDSYGGDNNSDGNATIPAASNWNGLIFNETAVDSACILNNALIRYANSALTVSGANPSLSNIELKNSTNGLNIGYDASATLNNANINTNAQAIYYSNAGRLRFTGTLQMQNNVRNYIMIGFPSFNNVVMSLPNLNTVVYFHQGFSVEVLGKIIFGDENIVKVANSSNINIHGKIIANASIGKTIKFTSVNDDNSGGDSNQDGTNTIPTSTSWAGIRIFGTAIDTACIFRRVTFNFAGNYNNGAITTINASPTIENCIFNTNYFGVRFEQASNPIFTNNTIGSSELTPISMSFDADPIFGSSNVFSFQDNDYDAIGLIGGTLTVNATLKRRGVTNNPNVTFLLLDEFTIPSNLTLTIQKGITIKSDGNSARKIIVNGTLTAIGTLDSMIVFTSAKDDASGTPGDTNKDGTQTIPSIGDFSGFVFNGSGASASVLNYCRINFGQYKAAYPGQFTVNNYQVNGGAITLLNSSPTITNCTIFNTDFVVRSYGISNPLVSNNTITNTTATPFAHQVMSNPTYTNNIFTNLGLTAIGLIGGDVSQNSSIAQRNLSAIVNVTYVILDPIIVKENASLTINAGVVLKVRNNVNAIEVEGTLRTLGTSINKVVFTTITDDNRGNPGDTNGDGNSTTPTKGNWSNINFKETSDDINSLIRHTDFWYGGSYSGSVLSWNNASAKISNVKILNSGSHGLSFAGSSAPMIDSVSIENGNLDPIIMSLLSNPTFNQVQVIANQSNGIKILEGTLGSDATLRKRSFVGIPNVTYSIGTLVVSSNATLTILPGVVIKSTINTNNSEIRVVGGLIANGTQNEKIIFTSANDDSNGGDYNNDGNTTTPNRSNWRGVRIINNSKLVSIKNCDFRYGGYYYDQNYSMMSFESVNSNVFIDSCVFQQISGSALNISGSSKPTIRNTSIINVGEYPVRLDMFSEPVFQNITFSNVGYRSIGVNSQTYSINDTVPVRNLGGFNNITYSIISEVTVNSGTTITIPQGLVFKGGYWNVNGKLIVNGTSSSPVVFTHISDDNYGNPFDLEENGPPSSTITNYGRSSIRFYDISDDASSVNNAIFRHYLYGVELQSSSANITNTKFDNVTNGVYLLGVSNPIVNGNTFNNCRNYPLITSLLSYPSSTLNNVISGSTYKAIRIDNETLVQDYILTKRNFAGITNIPYVFGSYTIGSNAILTINPGVVCKFESGGVLYVNKGLIAEGSSRADSNIVFTSFTDDFYGGDSNSDSNLTNGSNLRWSQIVIYGQAIDNLCRFKNTIFRFSNSRAISIDNASPSILNSSFDQCYEGIYITGASNPIVNFSDFTNIQENAINNVTGTFIINAENCWWFENTGPKHSSNPNGTGVKVSNFVDFVPFRTNNAQNPMMGDVSLNGAVQAYDASLLLQRVANIITFNNTQNNVADVSANAGISAFDASLVLQYVVGKIRNFPAEVLQKSGNLIIEKASGSISLDDFELDQNEEFVLPIRLNNVQNIQSIELNLNYDSSLIDYLGIENSTYTDGFQNVNTHYNDSLRLLFAGINSLNEDGILAYLKFRTKEINGIDLTTKIKINQFLANEDNLINNCDESNINIKGNTSTNIENTSLSRLTKIYPNPFKEEINIEFDLTDNSNLKVEIYDIFGKRIDVLMNVELANKAEYHLKWNTKNSSELIHSNGTYIIKIITKNDVNTYKVIAQ